MPHPSVSLSIPEIATDRLRLRAPSAADEALYLAFYGDPAASQAYGGPLSEAAAWKKLAQDIGHWALRGYGLWSIEVVETGGRVGGCGLVWPRGWPRPELTWWVLPSARRKGIATEASRTAIAWAHDNGWSRVETHMNDENVAARRLVAALGGVKLAREVFPDGLYRDVFALPAPGD